MNQENRRQVIIAGILGVILVGVLVYQFLIAGTSAPPPATSSGTAATTTASNKSTTAAPPAKAPERLKKVDVDLDKLIRDVEVVKFVYDNERIGRDPMTPLVGRILTNPDAKHGEEAAVSQNRLYSIRRKSVSGIIYNNYHPIAVVDDEVVDEGHQYPDGVVVTKIEPKRVWFQWRDTLIPVPLKEL